MNARLYSGSWWQWFWKDFSHPSPITTTLGWNFVLYLWAYTLPPSVLCNIQRMLPILLPSFSLNLDLQELQVLPVFLLSPCSYVRACWVVTDSLRPKGLQPTRLLCPWNSPGKNTGGCCHSFLQRIFPTQGSNLGLPHCGQILYCLSLFLKLVSIKEHTLWSVTIGRKKITKQGS